MGEIFCSSVRRACFVVLCVATCVLCHAFSYTYKGVKFNCKIKSGSVEITSFDRGAYNVTIPAKVNDKGVEYNVTKVATYRSGDSYSAVYLTLEEGIREIENYCFIEFRQLESVTLPSTIMKVGGKSFRDVEKINTFTAPEEVKQLVFGGKTARQTENERLLAEYEEKVKAEKEQAKRDEKERKRRKKEERELAEQQEKQRKAEEKAERERLEAQAKRDRELAKIEQKRKAEEAKQDRELAELERKRAERQRAYGGTVATVTPYGGTDVPQKPVATEIVSDIDDVPKVNVVNENYFALIIANEKYKYESPVEYAVRDGRAFSEYCKNVLGIPDGQIEMCENASLGDIRFAVESFLTRAASLWKNNCHIIVYYAGHGMPDEETNSSYMLPVDANAGDLVHTAYKLSDMYETLGKLPALSVTVFLDACFTGSSRAGQPILAARSVAVAPDEEELSGNVMVFAATSERQTALPYHEQGHGLFTYYLLKKLKESEGAVSYAELAEYVSLNVERTAFKFERRKEQKPTINVAPNMVKKWKTMKINAK